MNFFVLLVVVTLLSIISTASAFDEDFRSEIDSLREQILERKNAGQLEEARELQNLLKEKTSRRSRHGIDIDAMIDEKIKAHHEQRMEAHRARARSGSRGSSRKSSTTSNSGVKFSDSRPQHHMNQSGRKADILKMKIGKLSNVLSSEEVDTYNNRINEYLLAEEKIAALLQQTADEFGKARKILNKEERLAYLEKVKKAKQSRIELEKRARDHAREKFFSMNDELDQKINRGEL